MSLHDLIDDRQAEACSTLKLRLKGLEDLFCLLGVDSRAGIREVDLPVLAGRFRRGGEGSAAFHGPYRVFTEVPEDLFNFVAIGQRPCFFDVQAALDAYAGVFRNQPMFEKSESIFEQRH